MLDNGWFGYCSTDKDTWQDVPPFHVAAGNPARVIRRIDTKMDPEQILESTSTGQDIEGAEVPMAELANKVNGEI